MLQIAVVGDQCMQLLRWQIVLEEPLRDVFERKCIGVEAKIFWLLCCLLGCSHIGSLLVYLLLSRPKTRSPNMFRWISLVPAAMVPPNELK